MRGLMVDEPHDDRGLVHLLIGTLNAELLDTVVGVSDAGRVDEAEGDAMDEHRVLHRITRGAVDVADDSFVFVEQLIEQCAFAHIGLADDGHGNALFQRVSRQERVGEGRDAVIDMLCELDKLRSVSEFELLMVAEVQLQFEQRSHLQQLFAQFG